MFELACAAFNLWRVCFELKASRLQPVLAIDLTRLVFEVHCRAPARAIVVYGLETCPGGILIVQTPVFHYCLCFYCEIMCCKTMTKCVCLSVQFLEYNCKALPLCKLCPILDSLKSCCANPQFVTPLTAVSDAIAKSDNY